MGCREFHATFLAITFVHFATLLAALGRLYTARTPHYGRVAKVRARQGKVTGACKGKKSGRLWLDSGNHRPASKSVEVFEASAVSTQVLSVKRQELVETYLLVTILISDLPKILHTSGR